MSLTIYVAETNRSYGTGTSMAEAVLTMAANWHGPDPSSSVIMMIAECEGYRGGGLFEVDADTVTRREMFDVDPDEFMRLVDRAANREDDLLVESVVGDAEQLE